MLRLIAARLLLSSVIWGRVGITRSSVRYVDSLKEYMIPPMSDIRIWTTSFSPVLHWIGMITTVVVMGGIDGV
jgi:hypothetical protein